MATLIEYKEAVRLAADKTVFGPLYLGFPETTDPTVLRTVSDFDAERLQYHGQQGGSGAAITPTVGALDLLYTLQPGSKLVQVQVWAQSIDRLADSNELTTIASTNILVSRALGGDWDANLYEGNEMLDNQVDLLSPSLWEDLAEVSDLLLTPEIASVPVRVGPVISYQVSFQARLTA